MRHYLRKCGGGSLDEIVCSTVCVRAAFPLRQNAPCTDSCDLSARIKRFVRIKLDDLDYLMRLLIMKGMSRDSNEITTRQSNRERGTRTENSLV